MKKEIIKHLINIDGEIDGGEPKITTKKIKSEVEVKENLGEYSKKYTIDESPIQEGDFGYIVLDSVTEEPVQIGKIDPERKIIYAIHMNDNVQLSIISFKNFFKLQTDWKSPENFEQIKKRFFTEGTTEYKTTIGLSCEIIDSLLESKLELPDYIMGFTLAVEDH